MYRCGMVESHSPSNPRCLPRPVFRRQSNFLSALQSNLNTTYTSCGKTRGFSEEYFQDFCAQYSTTVQEGAFHRYLWISLQKFLYFAIQLHTTRFSAESTRTLVLSTPRKNDISLLGAAGSLPSRREEIAAHVGGDLEFFAADC